MSKSLLVTQSETQSFVQEHLPDSHDVRPQVVRLVRFWPRNELDLIPEMLYAHSNLSLEKITEAVRIWPMERKEAIFNARLKTKIHLDSHYAWDLTSECSVMLDWQRQGLLKDVQWQQLTPRFGYDVPAVIETAGLSDQFEDCFDLSLQLYSTLQAKGYPLDAQYATLLGHRLRWKINCSAHQASKLIEKVDNDLTKKVHQSISEVHPLIGESINSARNAVEQSSTERLKQVGAHQSGDQALA